MRPAFGWRPWPLGTRPGKPDSRTDSPDLHPTTEPAPDGCAHANGGMGGSSNIRGVAGNTEVAGPCRTCCQDSTNHSRSRSRRIRIECHKPRRRFRIRPGTARRLRANRLWWQSTPGGPALDRVQRIELVRSLARSPPRRPRRGRPRQTITRHCKSKWLASDYPP